MKIEIYASYPSFKRENNSYQIRIEPEDDVYPYEIAECFRLQFKERKCVVSWMRPVKFEGGIIFVGLKLPFGNKLKDLEEKE